ENSALRTPHSALSSYGISKLAAEEIVARHAADMPWTIVRPCAVYGPGDRDFLAIFSMIKRGVAIYPGTQHSALTTIYVDDLSIGMLAAARSPVAIGKTYFLGSEAHTRWSEIYHTIAKIMGRRIHLELDL